MDTYKNVKNDNNNISPDHNHHPNQKHKWGNSFRRDGYKFDPQVGSFSAAEPTEEEKGLLPKIQSEYRKKLADYMKRQGIENEDDVDPFKFPSLTEFTKLSLDLVRKGEPPEWLKSHPDFTNI